LGAACVRQDAAEIANGAWPVSQNFFFGHLCVGFTHSRIYYHTDPLRILIRPAGRHGRSEPSSPQRSRSSSPRYGEGSEKLKREQSFKANRHQKFIECLSREDVDMGSSSSLLLLFQFPSDSRIILFSPY
jgi:hypothetical protein